MTVALRSIFLLAAPLRSRYREIPSGLILERGKPAPPNAIWVAIVVPTESTKGAIRKISLCYVSEPSLSLGAPAALSRELGPSTVRVGEAGGVYLASKVMNAAEYDDDGLNRARRGENAWRSAKNQEVPRE